MPDAIRRKKPVNCTPYYQRLEVQNVLSVCHSKVAQPLHCSFHTAGGGMTLPHLALSSFSFVHNGMPVGNTTLFGKHKHTGSHWQVPQDLCP